MSSQTTPSKKQAAFGILAEFENAGALLHACEAVRAEGYRDFDAHTPMPVHGLEKAMGLSASPLPWIALIGGLTGAASGFALQGWIAIIASPLIISGKPLWSWPAFVPVAFELTILFAALGSVFGMLIINRLPRWHHPIFESERFARASDDRFFVSIEASDPKFDAETTANFMRDKAKASYVELVAFPDEDEGRVS